MSALEVVSNVNVTPRVTRLEKFVSYGGGGPFWLRATAQLPDNVKSVLTFVDIMSKQTPADSYVTWAGHRRDAADANAAWRPTRRADRRDADRADDAPSPQPDQQILLGVLDEAPFLTPLVMSQVVS